MPQSITPFRIEIGSAEIDDLRRRLAATRWPDRETTGDWNQGIPLDYMQSVAGYVIFPQCGFSLANLLIISRCWSHGHTLPSA